MKSGKPGDGRVDNGNQRIAGDSGNVLFDIINTDNLILNNISFYLESDQGGRSDGDKINSGDSGDVRFYFSNIKRLYFKNSLLSMLSGNVLESEEKHANTGIPQTGEIRTTFNVDNLIIENTSFSFISGDVILRDFGYSGAVKTYFNSRYISISNDSSFYFKKGIYQRYGEVNIFNATISDTFKVDQSSSFSFSGISEKPSINFKPDLFGRLNIFNESFGLNVDIIIGDGEKLFIYNNSNHDSSLNLGGTGEFNITEDETIFEEFYPYISGFNFKTHTGHSFDFYPLQGSFDLLSLDWNEILFTNYTIYKNGLHYENGTYVKGDDFMFVNRSNTSVGDNFTLELIPYSGETYGPTYSKTIIIEETNVSKLSKYEIKFNYSNTQETISLYDFYDSYLPEFSSMLLNVSAMSSWLYGNCEKNYCLMPFDITSLTKKLKINVLEPETEYEKIYHTYTTTINSSFYNTTDEVVIELIDEKSVFFISDRMVIE